MFIPLVLSYVTNSNVLKVVSDWIIYIFIFIVCCILLLFCIVCGCLYGE